MNKRIRQLVEQATDTVEIVNPDTGITHHREFFDKEKFAELIVGECAQQIDVYKMMKLDSNFYGSMLRSHFGVNK